MENVRVGSGERGQEQLEGRVLKKKCASVFDWKADGQQDTVGPGLEVRTAAPPIDQAVVIRHSQAVSCMTHSWFG